MTRSKFRFVEWLRCCWQQAYLLLKCIAVSDVTEFPGVSWDEYDIHSSVYSVRSFIRNISAIYAYLAHPPLVFRLANFSPRLLGHPYFGNIYLRILFLCVKWRHFWESLSPFIILFSLRILDKMWVTIIILELQQLSQL